jgi:ankyrin repeat protein
MGAKRQMTGLSGVLLGAVAACVLISACGDRQEEAVGELYQSDYAFTVEDFFRAAAAGDLVAVRWFLGAGMEPGVEDVSKTTALHMAAATGSSDVVRELLAHGAEASTERLDGRTPLMLAAEAGDSRSVKMLLDAGGKALGKDSHGWSALALAAYGGFERVVETLVPLSRPLLNDALLLAAIGGHVASIDHLVSDSALVDTRSPDERTPLMLAAARGHEDAVKILLHHGANWHATDGDEHTAAQMAAGGGHEGVVTILESAGRNAGERGGGDESFVPGIDGEPVLYSSRTRRLDGERLVGEGEVHRHLRMMAYRERQLPILFRGLATVDGQIAAEVRLLTGANDTFLVLQGEPIPDTNLLVVAIEEHWLSGKEGQGEPLRVGRMVVRDTLTGDVVGVTRDDPGKSAKSFALVRHEGTGQLYEVRRGDQFTARGESFRILDLRPREVLIESLESGGVSKIELP